ncbi:MAG: flagellar motor switch protein FliM [Pigmentiphaga sp.]|nr:flagellar motor switch protein FliM [Pigmentiphaga sp.]
MATYETMLSQDEVDALLAGVTGEEAASPKPQVLEGRVRPYDLGSPERIVRQRMHALEAINEHFARSLRASLLNFMRRSADITVGPIKVQKYSEFERNLPVPSNLNLVQLRPLRGTALFAYDPSLVFLIIDSLFGGDGRYLTRIEGRDFTLTEQRIIRRVVNLTLECYGRAWQPVHPIEPEYIRAEMHTKFANVTGPNEVVVTTPLHIEFGAAGGDLHVCLPYSMIEPVRDQLTRPIQEVELHAKDQRWTHLLSRQVRGAEVTLSADFLTLESTIGQLLRLRVGDMLPTSLPQTITAKIDGVPLMECAFGTFNGHHALRVLKMQAPAAASLDPSFSASPDHD